MLPIRLEIQGLFSYKTRQIIDFTRLTRYPLFGIFGKVGSGKSSLLDAMVFALYDASPRGIGVQGSARAEIVNLSSDEFTVVFDFSAGSGAEEKTYRFSVTNRRRRNNTMGVFSRSSYEWNGTEWIPFSGRDASDILGLSRENFIKTIIIPQGTFAEFLQMKGSDRTAMMIQLFPKLAGFDLQGKVSEMASRARTELDQLKGQLLEMGEEDPELNEEYWHSLIQSLESRVKTARAERDAARQKSEDLARRKASNDEWIQTSLDLSRQQENLPAMKLEKDGLDRFERLFRLFSGPLQQLSSDRQRLTRILESLPGLEQALQAAIEEELAAGQFLEAARKDSESIGELEKLVANLENAVLRDDLSRKIAGQEEQARKAREALHSMAGELKRNSAVKDKAAREIMELSGLESEKALLVQHKNWLEEKGRILEAQARAEGNRNKAEDDINLKKNEMEKLLRSPALEGYREGWSPGIKFAEFSRQMGLVLGQAVASRDKLQAIVSEAALHERLAALAAGLREGEPCPLCGSASHNPDAAAVRPAGDAASAEALRRANARIEQLEEIRRNLSGIEAGTLSLLRIRSDWEEEIRKFAADLERHREAGEKGGFGGRSAEEIDRELAHADEQLRLREGIRTSHDQARTEELRLSEAIASGQARLDEITSGLNQDMGRLQALPPSDGTEFPGPEEAALEVDKRKKQIAAIKEALHAAIQRKSDAGSALELARGRHSDAATQADALSLDCRKKEESLLQNLQPENIAGIADLEVLLSRGGDPQKDRERIDAFFREFNRLADRLASLKKEKADEPVPEADLEEAGFRAEEAGLLYDRESDGLAVESDRFRNWRQRQERFALLREKHRVADLHNQNVLLLRGLFEGRAFVNYASSHYLRNIVEMANHRFRSLTRNKLELQLDGENNFWVRDFLHQGQQRHIRTLSGGQMFQAALSLSLALADSVRHITRNERSFFFLDEGFGSLDREALGLVLETLRQLRFENRVVGIISHVEELRQELDQALLVELDPAHGSRVRFSGQEAPEQPEG